MTTFDRYLLRRFLHVFAVGFVSVFGLYVVIDVFSNVEDFVDVPGGPLGVMLEIIRYYSYRLSLFFERLGGVIAILSAMVTFALLQRYGELNPILSAGVPTYRLVGPVLFGAFLVDAAIACNRELLIPRIARQFQIDPGGKRETRSEVEPAYDIATMILINARNVNFAKQSAVEAEFMLPSYGVSDTGAIIRCPEAFWKPATKKHPNGWLLSDARVGYEDRPIDYDALPLTLQGRHVVRPGPKPGQLFVITDVSFDRLFRGDRNLEYIPSIDLMRRMRSPSFTDMSLRHQSLHLHSRVVRPLMDLLTVLLGLPLVARRGGQALIVNLAVCAVVMLGVVGIELTCGYMCALSLIPPDFAAWAPVIITGALSAWVREYIKT